MKKTSSYLLCLVALLALLQCGCRTCTTASRSTLPEAPHLAANSIPAEAPLPGWTITLPGE